MDHQTIRSELVDAPSAELTEAFDRLLPQLSTEPPADVEAQLLRVLACSTNHLLVCRDGQGRIVGALTLVIFPLPTGTRAWIEDVVVDADARGKGIGSVLILDAVRHAKVEGAKTIDLTSRPSRASANRLYERLGFVHRDTKVYRFETR